MVVFAFLPVAAFAVDSMPPEVRIFDRSLNQTNLFLALDQQFEGGLDVDTGDFDGDGDEEIVVGAGKNGGPMVQILESDGTVISQFFVYDERIHTGIKVAAGDLDNDGIDEIVTGVEYGGGPHVRVFDMQGNIKLTPGFFAFDSGFRGGVDVTVGDYDGDGKNEIAAAAGPSGSPHVRIFNKTGDYLGTDFRPFADDNRGGVSIASARAFNDSKDVLVTGVNAAAEAWVKVYDNDGTILGEWKAFDGLYTGVSVGVADIDNDGDDEIGVTPRHSAGPQVIWYEIDGTPIDNFFAYNDDFRGGLRLAGGDLNGNGKDVIITVPNKNRSQGRSDLIRYIETDVSDQKTRVYEYGELIKEFTVSTGIDKYPTPLGEFDIDRKIYIKDYKWSYGENHPDNYELKDVKWNLNYSGPFYFHYAYWHNNFGNKMSHGCTNMKEADAEWLYNWAEVGDVVINVQ